MNVFFGIKSENFHSNITVPKFRNNTFINKSYFLYKLNIVKSEWIYEKINREDDSDFYFINDKISNNENIFIISNDDEIKKISLKNEILDLNKFTNTSPSYRANLKIKINNGGFSSYQSEYPFHMITKKGNVLSPISSLLNINADHNFLIFKNIYYKPVIQNFCIYIVNIKTKKVLETIMAKSNNTNIINIEKEFIHSENFIFTKDFLGIPIYVSIKDKHLSMEHTHPPHEYILSDDKFYRVSLLKKKINEFIS